MKTLSDLPAALIGPARLARETLFRLWGPFERFLGPAELRGLPPLWLRRHAGPVAKFSSSARETRELLSRLSLLPEDGRVLDAGCGPGAMAIELEETLGPKARYVGFDVHSPSLRWCRKRFARDPRFSFELARIRTPYSRRFTGRAAGFRFPAGDASFDLVLAKSLFTHLLPPEAGSYLREIARVLAPRGRALVTAFLFDPLVAPPAFPFAEPGGSVRWRVRSRPEAAVAYPRLAFEEMVRDAGLRIEWEIAGFYPGNSPLPTGQDILVLERSEGARGT